MKKIHLRNLIGQTVTAMVQIKLLLSETTICKHYNIFALVGVFFVQEEWLQYIILRYGEY